MNLYQEQIIDHYKTPQNWGDLANANVSVVGNNPLCGDVISLKLKKFLEYELVSRTNNRPL